jgi:hypothetical protein
MHMLRPPSTAFDAQWPLRAADIYAGEATLIMLQRHTTFAGRMLIARSRDVCRKCACSMPHHWASSIVWQLLYNSPDDAQEHMVFGSEIVVVDY